MNRGPFGGRSKAAPTTLCQKCLKRDSYECTVTTQQRPYKSRPSRTQQLLNPDLKPKLNTEVPVDMLRRKGIADEILAKKEEERNPNKSSHNRPSRSRSPSSYSSDSATTISTTRSQSRSPPRKVIREIGRDTPRDKQQLGKRGRRSFSSHSDHSGSSHELRRSVDRNTRRRMSSFSPPQRGRRRSRSRSGRVEFSQDNGPSSSGFKRGLSESRSASRSHSAGARHMSRASRGSNRKRPVRPLPASRSRSRSSGRMDVSDDRPMPQNHNARVGRSPRRTSPRARRISTSRSRSRSARGRAPRSKSPVGVARSPSPASRRALPRSPSQFRSQRVRERGRGGLYGSSGRGGHQNGGGRHFDTQCPEPHSRNGPPPAPQRERSLSPYSKRVALTRQMHG